MDIDFNLDNHKYKKIDELLKSIENRFNRVSKLEVSLENRLIKLVENYEFDESGLKITDLEAKISQVNSRVYKQKVNLKLVSGSIEQTKKMINEDLVFFENNQFSAKELSIQIHEVECWTNSDSDTEAFMISKISHKMMRPLPDDIITNIVKLNNELAHINNTLSEIRALKKEMIDDYSQVRMAALIEDYERQINAEITIQSNEQQVMIEQISALEQSQEGSSTIENVIEMQDNSLITASVQRCMGRTAMCGITH